MTHEFERFTETSAQAGRNGLTLLDEQTKVSYGVGRMKKTKLFGRFLLESEHEQFDLLRI